MATQASTAKSRTRSSSPAPDDTLSVTFSDDALRQLKDLGKTYRVKSGDPTDVVKLAISVLATLAPEVDHRYRLKHSAQSAN